MANRDLRAGRAWEEEFHGWTDELLLGRKLKKPARAPKPRSSWSGVSLPQSPSVDYPGRGSLADIRARLKAVANRQQQVVIKIPAKGRKTAKSLDEHFKYLSRDYEESMRDQDGREITGREAVRDVTWAWKHTGPALDDHSDRKEAFHIIFSMREGTDERAVYGAVKATAEREFSGHQWVMVQHFDEPQVHVHVCVKTEALDGRRLDPRKPDLQRWRERFAYELRERGVEAEATRRAPRMQREKVNRPWGVTLMEQRGQATNPAPVAPPIERAEGWSRVASQAGDHYDKIIEALRHSEDQQDRQLAQSLERAITAAVVRNKATERVERLRTPQPFERG